MKRLVILVIASLLLASPAYARKEKVYRIVTGGELPALEGMMT